MPRGWVGWVRLAMYKSRWSRITVKNIPAMPLTCHTTTTTMFLCALVCSLTIVSSPLGQGNYNDRLGQAVWQGGTGDILG